MLDRWDKALVVQGTTHAAHGGAERGRVPGVALPSQATGAPRLVLIHTSTLLRGRYDGQLELVRYLHLARHGVDLPMRRSQRHSRPCLTAFSRIAAHGGAANDVVNSEQSRGRCAAGGGIRGPIRFPSISLTPESLAQVLPPSHSPGQSASPSLSRVGRSISSNNLAGRGRLPPEILERSSCSSGSDDTADNLTRVRLSLSVTELTGRGHRWRAVGKQERRCTRGDPVALCGGPICASLTAASLMAATASHAEPNSNATAADPASTSASTTLIHRTGQKRRSRQHANSLSVVSMPFAPETSDDSYTSRNRSRCNVESCALAVRARCRSGYDERHLDHATEHRSPSG